MSCNEVLEYLNVHFLNRFLRVRSSKQSEGSKTKRKIHTHWEPACIYGAESMHGNHELAADGTNTARGTSLVRMDRVTVRQLCRNQMP